MKNSIDLSKIRVKKLPTATITANLDGKAKVYTYRALSELEKSNLIQILSGDRDAIRYKSMFILLLSCGLDIPQSHAEIIFNSDAYGEANRICDAVLSLSDVFDSAKASEVEVAEKNSPAESVAAAE